MINPFTKGLISLRNDKFEVSNYINLLDRFDTLRKYILKKEENFLLSNLRKKTFEDLNSQEINCDQVSKFKVL